MANEQEELETADQDETERIWAEEADRRYEEIRRGEATVEDSEEVFREARARLLCNPESVNHVSGRTGGEGLGRGRSEADSRGSGHR